MFTFFFQILIIQFIVELSMLSCLQLCTNSLIFLQVQFTAGGMHIYGIGAAGMSQAFFCYESSSVAFFVTSDSKARENC